MPSFEELPNTTISLSVTEIQTSGETRGLLIYDAALSAADVQQHPLAMVSTQTENGQARVFRRDERALNVRQFGAGGGYPHNDSPAFAAAIAYAARFGAAAASYLPGASRVRVPAGRYYLATPVPIKAGVILEGDKGVFEGGDGTLIETESTAFSIDRADTLNGVAQNSVTTGGDGSIISGMVLRYRGSTPFKGYDQTSGVIVRARCLLEALSVENYPGAGIQIIASSGAGGSERGNANLWRVRNCTVSGNFYGLYVRGSDANAGYCEGLNANFNVSCGVLDSSFLGNTFIACHTSGNGGNYQRADGVSYSLVARNGRRYFARYGISEATLRATAPETNANIWGFLEDGGPIPGIPEWTSSLNFHWGAAYATTDRNARSLFIGCYTEGTQAPAQIIWPSMAIGGLLAQSSDGIWANGEQSALNAHTISAGAVSIGATDQALAINTTNTTFRVKPYGVDIRMDFGNLDEFTAALVTGPSTNRACGPAKFAFGDIALAYGEHVIRAAFATPTDNPLAPTLAFNAARRAAADAVGWTHRGTGAGASAWVPFGATS